MTLDAKMRATAARLIGKYGKSIVYTAVATGAYDPATGSSSGTTKDYPVKATIESYSDFDVAKGLVNAGDRKVMIAASALPVTPSSSDQLKIDGIAFSIVKADPIYSGEQPAAWEIQARRS